MSDYQSYQKKIDRFVDENVKIKEGLMRLVSMVATTNADGSKRKVTTDDDYYTERLPNRAVIEALDNSLYEGSSVELSEFVVQTPCKALLATEERTIEVKQYPLTKQPVNRCGIKDTVTNDKRPEVIFVVKNGKRVKPCIHVSCDLGSVGYPAILWLLCKAKILGTMVASDVNSKMITSPYENSSCVELQ